MPLLLLSEFAGCLHPEGLTADYRRQPYHADIATTINSREKVLGEIVRKARRLGMHWVLTTLPIQRAPPTALAVQLPVARRAVASGSSHR